MSDSSKMKEQVEEEQVLPQWGMSEKILRWQYYVSRWDTAEATYTRFQRLSTWL